MGTANIMIPQMSGRTLVSYTVCPEAAVVPPPRAHRALRCIGMCQSYLLP